MQNQLISPDEVIELAFSPHDQIDPIIVTDTRIEAAQLKFLAPALNELYPALINGLYPDFCRDYIKPALSYFVKYHIFQNLSTRIGSDSIIRIRPADSTLADSSEIARMRRESRETAVLLLQKAFEYLKKHNGEFPEFKPESHKGKRPRINGGIIV